MPQKSPTESSKDVMRSPSQRSRVANGSDLFSQPVDMRTTKARRFRDLVEQIASDLGGNDLLSEAQRQLIRRCATLSAHCEEIEAGFVRGEEIDIELYGQLTNILGRALSRLGLKRVARDITPQLDQYLNDKNGAENESDRSV